jgi:ParB family chromosome partitioning protein
LGYAASTESLVSLPTHAIMKIKIADIIIPEGRRAVSESKVAELAESISVIGLITPVVIREDKTLVAGAHRIAAYRHLGYDKIEYTEFEGDDMDAELVEIDENLMRNELHYIERGELAIRRDEILEMKGLRARIGDNQHSKWGGAESSPPPTPEIPDDDDPESPRWKMSWHDWKYRQDAKIKAKQTTADIAKSMGVSERTLQVEKQIAKNLIPEAKQAAKEKRITKDAALALSRLSPERQRAALKKNNGKVQPTHDEKRKQTDAKKTVEPKAQKKFARIPLPIEHVTAYYALLDHFQSESKEVRGNVVNEIKILAEIIDHLSG